MSKLQHMRLALKNARRFAHAALERGHLADAAAYQMQVYEILVALAAEQKACFTQAVIESGVKSPDGSDAAAIRAFEVANA